MPQRQGSDPWPPETVWRQMDDQMWNAHLVPEAVDDTATFIPADAYYQLAYVQDLLDSQKRHHRRCQAAEPIGLICVMASDGQHIVWPTRHAGCLVRILSDIASPVQIVGLTGPGTWLAWDRAPRDLSELEGPTW